MNVLNQLPLHDQGRSVGQTPMFDQVTDLRSQISNPFGHQSSQPNQTGESNFSGSQMSGVSPYIQPETRSYSTGDFGSQSNTKIDQGIGKYLTAPKQQHQKQGLVHYHYLLKVKT